tara:strand:+ start:234 stop:1448 length:1215 start_codon:yes stop_codon:yes gene_type:complete
MNDPITPFSGLEKLIEDFIKEQNNELINKKRSTSDPINQVIKKTDGGKVLMTLGPVIFKERKVFIWSGSGNSNDVTYNNKKCWKLKKISWLLYFFEIEYSQINGLGGKPVTGGNSLWRKQKDFGYLSFKNKIVTLILPEENPILPIIDELKKIKIENLIDENKKQIKLREKKIKEERDKRLKKEEEIRVKNLNKSKSEIFKRIDKDGNGIVDIIEGNDFEILLKHNQKKIIEVDRTYIQKFIKISNYLKIQKENIQKLFNKVKSSPNQKSLNEYIKVLEEYINSYNLLVLGSLNMIVSLVDDDMITFYDLYERFDNLNIFDSKHEKDLSEKLDNVNVNLNEVCSSIIDVGDSIVNSLDTLTDITLQTQNNIIKQLKGVNSKLSFGNFLKGIQIYQKHRILKKLK